MSRKDEENEPKPDIEAWCMEVQQLIPDTRQRQLYYAFLLGKISSVMGQRPFQELADRCMTEFLKQKRQP
jgi:hypothetical protein